MSLRDRAAKENNSGCFECADRDLHAKYAHLMEKSRNHEMRELFSSVVATELTTPLQSCELTRPRTKAVSICGLQTVELLAYLIQMQLPGLVVHS